MKEPQLNPQVLTSPLPVQRSPHMTRIMPSPTFDWLMLMRKVPR
ncbi:hypothetical protein V1290_002519 [Bradyrhizobium sp. AZCC 1578]